MGLPRPSEQAAGLGLGYGCAPFPDSSLWAFLLLFLWALDSGLLDHSSQRVVWTIVLVPASRLGTSGSAAHLDPHMAG